MEELKALSCPFCNGTKLKADQKKSGNFRYVDGERMDACVEMR